LLTVRLFFWLELKSVLIFKMQLIWENGVTRRLAEDAEPVSLFLFYHNGKFK
jgi:hypothetical protein